MKCQNSEQNSRKVMKKSRKIFKLKLRSLPSLNGHQLMRRNSPYSENMKSLRRYHKRRSGLYAHKNIHSDASFFDISKWKSPAKKV